MYILNISNAIKKMAVNEIRDLIFENFYKWIGFSKKNPVIIQWNIRKKDLQLFAIKLTEKKLDSHNGKECFQSFIRKKNTKSAKQLKIITQQPKYFENPNIYKISYYRTSKNFT